MADEVIVANSNNSNIMDRIRLEIRRNYELATDEYEIKETDKYLEQMEICKGALDILSLPDTTLEDIFLERAAILSDKPMEEMLETLGKISDQMEKEYQKYKKARTTQDLYQKHRYLHNKEFRSDHICALYTLSSAGNVTYQGVRTFLLESSLEDFIVPALLGSCVVVPIGLGLYNLSRQTIEKIHFKNKSRKIHGKPLPIIPRPIDKSVLELKKELALNHLSNHLIQYEVQKMIYLDKKYGDRNLSKLDILELAAENEISPLDRICGKKHPPKSSKKTANDDEKKTGNQFVKTRGYVTNKRV